MERIRKPGRPYLGTGRGSEVSCSYRCLDQELCDYCLLTRSILGREPRMSCKLTTKQLAAAQRIPSQSPVPRLDPDVNASRWQTIKPQPPQLHRHQTTQKSRRRFHPMPPILRPKKTVWRTQAGSLRARIGIRRLRALIPSSVTRITRVSTHSCSGTMASAHVLPLRAVTTSAHGR